MHESSGRLQRRGALETTPSGPKAHLQSPQTQTLAANTASQHRADTTWWVWSFTHTKPYPTPARQVPWEVGGQVYCLHFMDEKTESQRRAVICSSPWVVEDTQQHRGKAGQRAQEHGGSPTGTLGKKLWGFRPKP